VVTHCIHNYIAKLPLDSIQQAIERSVWQCLIHTSGHHPRLSTQIELEMVSMFHFIFHAEKQRRNEPHTRTRKYELRLPGAYLQPHLRPDWCAFIGTTRQHRLGHSVE